ncbi:DUF5082 domain-containing protein [Bacillus aquiflavi]|uniref:DUF5082 domain-containing protein n=1 Tax=Bacillus aquiflavi TaxID=2672567 RepID=A0A6B3VWZ6_9BACI|nr:DUF5082 domain-containing protein [Bacillus aquiflavi]MBA4535558.1 DUF5082 domain-containing protein [Bacillus aquiflavi]NEY79934.1 DUF5082 domain-containing protein [Bacillus aquiflavi]UAC48878.1 DUF5082 domain-containing protein [Bacillus aquiflavi]
MGYAEMLSQIYGTISSRSADINEKIERLRQAKRKIEQEQNTSLGEIKKIKQPELANSWKGERAISFNESRLEAFKVINEIINDDYDDYKQEISLKMGLLTAEKGVLDMASGLANEASNLLSKGEEALEELSNKINEIKRRLA